MKNFCGEVWLLVVPYSWNVLARHPSCENPNEGPVLLANNLYFYQNQLIKFTKFPINLAFWKHFVKEFSSRNFPAFFPVCVYFQTIKYNFSKMSMMMLTDISVATWLTTREFHKHSLCSVRGFIESTNIVEHSK